MLPTEERSEGSAEMNAVVIEGPGEIDVGEVPDPRPGPEDVVIAVNACGICGTDLHVVDGEFALAKYPLVPGHEFAGEVVDAGAEVKGIAVGTRVTADPNQPCGRCRPCREGHANLCEDFRALGITAPGACADYVVVPYWLARTLPEDFDMSVGALIEPLSCAVHAYDLTHTRLGDRFLIYGAGTMGLMLVALAQRAGAVSVAVVEPHLKRRQLAESFGASAVFASSAELGDERFNTVIDASGVVQVIEDAMSRVRRGGTYLQFGVAPADATARYSPFRLYNDETHYVGSMAVLHSFDRARDLAVELDLGLSKLVTDTYPISNYASALEQVRAGIGLKIQVASEAQSDAN
jgi:2-desacetyl-2-hydroxyethyl bacteriochlorophyllide A dehydrogenase